MKLWTRLARLRMMLCIGLSCVLVPFRYPRLFWLNAEPYYCLGIKHTVKWKPTSDLTTKALCRIIIINICVIWRQRVAFSTATTLPSIKTINFGFFIDLVSKSSFQNWTWSRHHISRLVSYTPDITRSLRLNKQIEMRKSHLLILLLALVSTAHVSHTSTSSTNSPQPSTILTCPPFVDKQFCTYGCGCKCINARVSCPAAGTITCGQDNGTFCEEQCSCSATVAGGKIEV
jgi:hypothetical protein